HAFARENPDARNTLRQKVGAMALDPEHGAVRRVTSRKARGSHWEDQPAVVAQTVKPDLRRPRRAGVDEDDIRPIESDARAVALDDADVGGAGEIRREPRGQTRVEFDGGDPPAAANEMLQDCGVVSDAGADMDDVLARFGASRADQGGQERG